MMGGEIWVESKWGWGSQFYFNVSVEAAERSASEQKSTPSPECLRGMRVLIVDDNQTNLRILNEALARWQMRPTCADGGVPALAALSAAVRTGDPYGLILTDLHMPDMDGFTFIEQTLLRSESSPVSIMMLSSAARPNDLTRCRELGVSRYLLKPVRESELREAVMAVFSRDLASITPPLLQIAEQTPPVPIASLRILVAEDNPVNQRLVLRLLEIRGHRVTVADDGRQAVAAVREKDFDLIFMDVQMPHMSGVEATALIRRDEESGGRRLPIIALTAHAMKGDREKCLASGMDGYLAKPIRAHELDAILERCAQSAATRHAVGPPAPIPVALG
jgi:two-component system sensor histidine kinase/response regulator